MADPPDQRLSPAPSSSALVESETPELESIEPATASTTGAGVIERETPELAPSAPETSQLQTPDLVDLDTPETPETPDLVEPAEPGSEGPSRPPGSRRRLDEVFGDVLPGSTRDERGDRLEGDRDADYRRDVPPHHG